MVLLKFQGLGIQNKWHDKKSRCHSQIFPDDPWVSTTEVPVPLSLQLLHMDFLWSTCNWLYELIVVYRVWCKKIQENFHPEMAPSPTGWHVHKEPACASFCSTCSLYSFHQLAAPWPLHAVDHLQAFAHLTLPQHLCLLIRKQTCKQTEYLKSH